MKNKFLNFFFIYTTTNVMKDMDYIPINCSFYDFIEIFASRKQKISIHFERTNGDSESIDAVILDTLVKDKVEYIILSNNTTLRCDHIISLNGIINPSYTEK
ncbi:Rho-binding antiterminator [Membranihabitans marinus]|uniref:Rho-binding antiterminator n=1 Tax=Membranihabitans marinus TaxID=1227546 RepID=UPI001F3F0594|nr:Rho-binding antiterminator [Membranihabitans marinus]